MNVALLMLLAQLDGGRVIAVDAAALHPGDAGVPASNPFALTQVTAVVLEAADGGWFPAGPGCYLPVPLCLASGQHVVDLEAQNVELRRVPPGVVPQLIAFTVGLLGGGGVAFVAGCELATGSPVCASRKP